MVLITTISPTVGFMWDDLLVVSLTTKNLAFEAFICAIFLDQNETDYVSKLIADTEPSKNLKRDLRLIGPGWVIVNAFVENFCVLIFLV